MKERIKKYATLIVKKGINVQKDQLVVISAPIECYEFVRILVNECYLHGAKEVIVDYIDNYNLASDYIYKSLDTLESISEYIISKNKYYVDNKASFIAVVSPDVDAFNNIDANKIKHRQLKLAEKLKFLRDFKMSNKTSWCVCAASSSVYAKKLFPTINNHEAKEKVWEYILDCCYIDDNPVSTWTKHSDLIKEHAKKVNDLNLEKLVFKNSLGTNLELYLAKNSIFVGGDETTSNNIVFSPNIPTEEIFSMPYKTKVNGVVYSTKPLLYQGILIEDFKLEFKDGKVINYEAKKGIDALRSLIEFDSGSKYLGEVALVEYSSIINKKDILFYNTLFDENASCHLALGQAYTTNIKDVEKYTKEELESFGMNYSKVHVDFMFGSKCMNIYGYTKDNKEIQIFKDGMFCLK